MTFIDYMYASKNDEISQMYKIGEVVFATNGREEYNIIQS